MIPAWPCSLVFIAHLILCNETREQVSVPVSKDKKDNHKKHNSQQRKIKKIREISRKKSKSVNRVKIEKKS